MKMVLNINTKQHICFHKIAQVVYISTFNEIFHVLNEQKLEGLVVNEAYHVRSDIKRIILAKKRSAKNAKRLLQTFPISKSR